MKRMPFDYEVSFRGITRAPGTFVDKTTGQLVESSAQLLFEYIDPDGVLVPVDFAGSAFDKLDPKVDWRAFSVGDVIRVYGVTVVQDRGSDRDSYVQLSGAAVLVAA